MMCRGTRRRGGGAEADGGGPVGGEPLVPHSRTALLRPPRRLAGAGAQLPPRWSAPSRSIAAVPGAVRVRRVYACTCPCARVNAVGGPFLREGVRSAHRLYPGKRVRAQRTDYTHTRPRAYTSMSGAGGLPNAGGGGAQWPQGLGPPPSLTGMTRVASLTLAPLSESPRGSPYTPYTSPPKP